jgi:DNA-binding MarR family transcriptional regulator
MSTPAPAPAPPPAATELDPQAQVGRAFKAALTSVRRLRGRETQQLGRLSHAQYSLLFGLAEQAELSSSRLAAQAELAPGTVTEMLDHLVADGLVKRTRSARDKRVVMISLTDQGGELVRARREKMEALWKEALAGFSEDELRTAVAVLERLGELFDSFQCTD